MPDSAQTHLSVSLTMWDAIRKSRKNIADSLSAHDRSRMHRMQKKAK